MKGVFFSSVALFFLITAGLWAEVVEDGSTAKKMASPEPSAEPQNAVTVSGLALYEHALTVPPVKGLPDKSALSSLSPMSYEVFPRLFYTNATFLGRYWVESESESYALRSFTANQLLNTTILAYYGSPVSKKMGILGRFNKESIAQQLTALSRDYDSANGDKSVQTAFYLIYGTCWPEGKIGYLSDKIVKEYIEYALKNNMIVFLDHQIGKFGVEDSMAKLLPWLRYPNVHLALDPEWRTLKPMQEIGRVEAAEINAAQRMMQRYIIDNDLPGSRMLVVHQFNSCMIQNRPTVRADYDRVLLVHCADGFGKPNVKLGSYLYNVIASNMPLKGYKLFYKSGLPGAGFDDPLLRPQDVMGLNPCPVLIMYQ
jgi:hypothetical protein